MAFLAGLILVLGSALAQGGLAVFTGQETVTGNTFSTDTLDPPTGLTATGGYSIVLNWTATVDSYASGYRVLRSTTAGGPYSQIAEVTPRTTTGYGDKPAAGTYYYVVRSFFQNWESDNSNEASATKTSNTSTGFHSPNAEAAVSTGSGDNNGFETNPLQAFGNSPLYAQDIDSGSGTGTSCTSTDKDRHLFYDYGFSVPAGSTIEGIEVQLDAWADSTSGSPFMCVELSWDGGTTWTTAKTTPTLGTSEQTFILGAASDTWGRTWGASDFSDANLRVRITNVASSTARDFRLDWVPVQLTYTPPAGLFYTGFRNCTTEAAVTSSSGDNNGFQTSPTNACADDAAFALDNNSGTSTSTSCTSTAKDRHLFYGYNFGIPAGSTIDGVEVRLDAKLDSVFGEPHMCAEVSWDGGATWTTAKTTFTIATMENSYFLGSPSDTWGRTWSASDFSDANFRLRITNVASSTFRDFELDWAAVQVAYTPP